MKNGFTAFSIMPFFYENFAEVTFFYGIPCYNRNRERKSYYGSENQTGI